MAPEDDVQAERRLLIDPCLDNPEEYLGYDPLGQVFALNENPTEKAIGETTIEVFHLARRRLRDLRRERIALVTKIMELMAIPDSTAGSELGALLASMQANEYGHAGVARYVSRRPAEFGL